MYAYLSGKFTEKTPAQVYVDVNGVGYEVNISLNTRARSGEVIYTFAG
jgi:holliday junction DNA helicase RuvA